MTEPITVVPNTATTATAGGATFALALTSWDEADEFERFETLAKRLVQVPKDELNAKREK